MTWTKNTKSIQSLVISFSVYSLFIICLVGLANAQMTFPGTGAAAIPDRGAAGCGPPSGPNLDILFDASAISGAVTDVSIDVDITHTWVGDVEATLVAPDGTEHILFANTGFTMPPDSACGDASDLVGLYTFNDGETGDWWAASVANPVELGGYRTTTRGGTGTGGVASDMNAAFAGVESNGTWKLQINDSGFGDSGAVASAALTLTAGVVPSGPPWNDFDGDGTSDFNVARDEAPGLAGSSKSAFQAGSYRERLKQIQENPKTPTDNVGVGAGSDVVWYVHNSGSASAGITGHGSTVSDFITPNDFDGDGKHDLAVWRTAAAPGASFFILDSSTMTVREEPFGTTGDNSTVTGDYDGDGAADVAVFRCPATPGTCTFYYRGSAGGGETTFVPWGNGTTATLFPNTGDFDGDGKHDFCLQRDSPMFPGSGQFVLLRSSDSGVQFVNWGSNTDVIVPGDYDGDGKDDFAIRRNQGGQLTWYVLDSDGSTVQQYGIPFGIFGDFATPGDYDGDGKTDISIWRPDPGDPDNNFFYVYRSSDGMVQSFEWGNGGDYPSANSQVN